MADERIKVPERFVVSTLEPFRRVVDVVLDFSATSYLDAAAVALLITWKQDLFAKQATLRLEGLNPDIRELFRFANLTTLVPEAAEPTEDE